MDYFHAHQSPEVCSVGGYKCSCGFGYKNAKPKDKRKLRKIARHRDHQFIHKLKMSL